MSKKRKIYESLNIPIRANVAQEDVCSFLVRLNLICLLGLSGI